MPLTTRPNTQTHRSPPFPAARVLLRSCYALTFSIASTTSMPLTTRPNTECLPSSQGVGTVVMKNCGKERLIHGVDSSPPL